MVLLISALVTIGVTKSIFWILVPLRGRAGVGSCVRGHGLLSVHSLYTIDLLISTNSIFFVSNSNLCRAMLPNYLRTYSSALCQIRVALREGI